MDGVLPTQTPCVLDPSQLQLITVRPLVMILHISVNVFIVCVQLGNVIAANIYLTSDKPLYHAGNTHLIIINVLVILLFLLTKVYYVMRNRIRDKQWNAMTAEVSHVHCPRGSAELELKKCT